MYYSDLGLKSCTLYGSAGSLSSEANTWHCNRGFICPHNVSEFGNQNKFKTAAVMKGTMTAPRQHEVKLSGAVVVSKTFGLNNSRGRQHQLIAGFIAIDNAGQNDSHGWSVSRCDVIVS